MDFLLSIAKERHSNFSIPFLSHFDILTSILFDTFYGCGFHEDLLYILVFICYWRSFPFPLRVSYICDTVLFSHITCIYSSSITILTRQPCWWYHKFYIEDNFFTVQNWMDIGKLLYMFKCESRPYEQLSCWENLSRFSLQQTFTIKAIHCSQFSFFSMCLLFTHNAIMRKWTHLPLKPERY